MAAMLVRNIDDDVKERLRARAKRNGRSLEAEARSLLEDAATKEDAPSKGLGTQLVELFREFDLIEVELEPLPRSHRKPIDFGK